MFACIDGRKSVVGALFIVLPHMSLDAPASLGKRYCMELPMNYLIYQLTKDIIERAEELAGPCLLFPSVFDVDFAAGHLRVHCVSYSSFIIFSLFSSFFQQYVRSCLRQ